MSRKIKIAHATSVHQRYDVRIFEKQVKTLASVPELQVDLLVNDSLENETIGDISIINLLGFKPRQRYRIIFTNWIFLFFILIKRYRLVHFHDPELIPVLLPLRLFGIKVIYDVHEDYTTRLKAKQSKIMNLIAAFAVLFEGLAGKYCSGVVTVTTPIDNKFRNYGSVQVRNYPIVSSSVLVKPEHSLAKPLKVVYAGGLTKERGLDEILMLFEALVSKNIEFHIAGPCDTSENNRKLNNICSKYPNKFFYHGMLRKNEVEELMVKSDVGLLLLHPTDAYRASLPVKLFEYISCGVFVLGSDFDGFSSIIKDNQVGWCVDPCDPRLVLQTMSNILQNPDCLENVRKNGRSIIHEAYSWASQEKSLMGLYSKILGVTLTTILAQ